MVLDHADNYIVALYGVGLCIGPGSNLRGGVEMEKTTVEKLREHCQGILKRHEGSDGGRDWAFGAVCFAYSADLIAREEFKALLEEFELVPSGSVL